MKKVKIEKQIANILKVLGSPFRVKLLFSIGYGETCVCHLEAILKKRQAYISQNLMVLRDAGILDTRRDGKYIFYRVVDEKIFELLKTAAVIQNTPSELLPKLSASSVYDNCACPNCEPEYTK